MDGRNVTIKAADGQTLTYNGQPVKEGPLRLSENKRPADLITFKSTTFFLHFSGPRLAFAFATRTRRCAGTSRPWKCIQ